MKIVNKSSDILNDLRNFNEIFRKDVAYDKIKSHKETGLHSLFLSHSFVKPQGGSNCSPSLFRVNIMIVASDTRTLIRSKIGRYYSNNIIFCNPRTPKMYLCLMAVPHNAFKPAHKPAFSSLTTFAR